MLKVKQGSTKVYFWVFGMTQRWTEPLFTRPFAYTQTIMPMGLHIKL